MGYGIGLGVRVSLYGCLCHRPRSSPRASTWSQPSASRSGCGAELTWPSSTCQLAHTAREPFTYCPLYSTWLGSRLGVGVGGGRVRVSASRVRIRVNPDP